MKLSTMPGLVPSPGEGARTRLFAKANRRNTTKAHMMSRKSAALSISVFRCCLTVSSIAPPLAKKVLTTRYYYVRAVFSSAGGELGPGGGGIAGSFSGSAEPRRFILFEFPSPARMNATPAHAALSSADFGVQRDPCALLPRRAGSAARTAA